MLGLRAEADPAIILVWGLRHRARDSSRWSAASGPVALYTSPSTSYRAASARRIFYGADGKPWFPLEEQRLDVPLARISPDLQHAVVAIEDHRFYHHPGIDPIGIGRAVVPRHPRRRHRPKAAAR